MAVVNELTDSDQVLARRYAGQLTTELYVRAVDLKTYVNENISPDDIATDSTHRFVTDAQIATWNSGSGGSSTISFLAAADIDAYLLVTSTGVRASSATSAHRGKVIGITTAAVVSGFMGTVTGFGTITNALWAWTIGDKIYLNGTSLSTTAPSSGFIQYVGTATASDTIDVNLGEPILL